ncbi:cyclic nucleotide-binding domain-containing protein [Anabaena cylindrica FACHB-243]|uniref:histidine kinase n=1 Tax=Anabaena cylindrica (strain ATCC 27899 / PCC 7122) TaxID=272123 RepID=K9ZMK0_ANACC|nr:MULTISPECIES: ATP-binding protein [Anabaena]AFZ59752.1 histidine kinase [Anabaena cylindrica PCC 7122]MBD2417157.1 cyclic nucleotide-binding domain-containing protein [Anabaena cylindrica FACHB-243]MBY5283625.1 cyclic nucleotide-binding domain-containing protein [Anabaena sp. CCAP 1446/1C]MBY5310259.1 cyclic nucleotide-binding domain-containing protein [Anabaena sp. CCAP 1446/1C]MCM2405027.1 ATP-binding protein [Anabaena sp. CCAP 1446/1C]
MQQESNNSATLFPRLSDEVLQHLKEYGTEINLSGGEYLFKEGDSSYDFHVVLEGEIQVTKQLGGQEKILAKHQRGEFIGELSILTETDSVVSGYATVASRILKLELKIFKQIIATFPPLADIVISTLAARTKTVEQQLQQQEKLASLGKLSAGIAHELKNPAVAGARVAEELQTRFQEAQTLALRLHQYSFTNAQLDFLADFQDHTQAGIVSTKLDLLMQSDIEDEITDWLEEHQVSKSWEITSVLVDAGLDSHKLELITLKIPTNAINDVIHWLAANLTTATLIKEIEQSSARISELVKSVKSYAHINQLQVNIQQVDVHEGIENTLTMLRHKLKGGIDIKREYGQNLPFISTYGSELNQVWTNLIDNAIDALEGKGKICIRTFQNDDYLIVEIADNGSGIPPEIQSRIFEPFFTTKGVGQGSGLGLDIVHNLIVDRHHGKIQLHSQAGETRFQIFLPIGIVIN